MLRPAVWNGELPENGGLPDEALTDDGIDENVFRHWQRRKRVENAIARSHDTPAMHRDWRTRHHLTPGLELAHAALKQVTAGELNGVYLYGGPGTGKTWISGRWTLWMRQDLKAARWASVSRYLGELRDAVRDSDPLALSRAKHSIETAEILVLDDLGAERVTDFAREAMTELIDYRWANQLPYVGTSNLYHDALIEHIGDRAVSRLLGSCRAIEVAGADHRLASAVERDR